MTNEEAIEILKTWRISGDKSHEALSMAIKALEKQIPKKPMKSIDPYNNILYKLNCPTCGKYINRVGTPNKFTVSPDMCGFCGQKIDFGG